MINITVKAARDLSMQRLREELGMCQRLCDTMDKQLGPYMTILGRLAVLKVMQRLNVLPGKHRPPVFKRWAGEMQWYGPWTLLREKTGALHEKDNIEVFMDKNANRLLHPGFPWGVLTLGGLMRAYAEMSEMIYGEVKDQGVLKLTKKDREGVSTGEYYTDPQKTPLPSATGKTGWEKQRIMEEQGRLSWQRNLIDMYGYDLFKKREVKLEKLSDKEKSTPGLDLKKLEQQKLKAAQEKLAKDTAVLTPTDDRMRFERDIIKEDIKRYQSWADEYKSLGPDWTKAGRVKWQTMLLDRISLIGDLYGLVRGATISGTTSDHAYSFWQLCDDIRTMNKTEAGWTYVIITQGAGKVPGPDAWARHSADTLKAAFDTMRTDEGFARVLRMMMLVPVVQMGVEMHHSVHEMASVIGLNDMINWRVGYYDTLFMTLKELKALEEKFLARYRKLAKTPGTGFSAPRLKNTGHLEIVENAIKKLLKEATEKVLHGFFATLDPSVVNIAADNWGGVVMEKQQRSAHWDTALLDQETMKALNARIRAGKIGALGVNKQCVDEMLLKGPLKFTLGEKPDLLSDVHTLYVKIMGEVKAAQYQRERQTIRAIQNANTVLWRRYKDACDLPVVKK